MATIQMTDTDYFDINITSMKNSLSPPQVINPMPPVAPPTSNLPGYVDVTLLPDGVTVRVSGKPGQTTPSAPGTVTVTPAANPNAKFQQVFQVTPNPNFPVSIQATVGPVTPQ